MKKSNNENVDPKEMVGIVIGRFQVASLTDGHMELLNYVISKNYGTNVIILGLSPLKCTTQNPLDFEARKNMIEDAFPGKFTILYVKDCKSDKSWSQQVDDIIQDICGSRPVKLIGSRDCFYNHYFGKFKDNFEEYVQTRFVSGSEQRKKLSNIIKRTSDWRSGVVYATQNKYPTVFPTVDCAIFSDDTFLKVYLAKKKNQDGLYRFVGGFADPKDNCFETSARREAEEETKLSCSVIDYIGSFKIDDWRYTSETDKIITSFYAMVKQFGRPTPSDDIDELVLVNVTDLKAEMFVSEHVVLYKALINWVLLNSKKNISIPNEVIKQLD